jgi:hypothetical protein
MGAGHGPTSKYPREAHAAHPASARAFPASARHCALKQERAGGASRGYLEGGRAIPHFPPPTAPALQHGGWAGNGALGWRAGRDGPAGHRGSGGQALEGLRAVFGRWAMSIPHVSFRSRSCLPIFLPVHRFGARVGSGGGAARWTAVPPGWGAGNGRMAGAQWVWVRAAGAGAGRARLLTETGPGGNPARFEQLRIGSHKEIISFSRVSGFVESGPALTLQVAASFVSEG